MARPTTPPPGSDRFVWGEFKIVKPPPTPTDEDETALTYRERLALLLDWDEELHPRDHAGQFAEKGEIEHLDSALQDHVRRVVGKDVFGTPRAEKPPPWHEYPQPVRAAIKQENVAVLTARLRTEPEFKDLSSEDLHAFVKGRVGLWALSSGDSDIYAVRMQTAVKEEFGLTDAPMDHLTAAHIPDAVEEARNRAYVRAEYAETQQWFKDRGITHVSVMRGMGDEDDELGSGIETVTMQPASSWTTDLKTAVSFARDQEVAAKILTARVPVADVLSTCVTGRGCLPEHEVILLGRQQQVRIFGGDLDEETGQYVFPVERIERTLR